MIGLKVNGEYLDMDNDTSIQLELNNPLLADEDTLSPGSFSFPFDVPSGKGNHKNARILKHPDVVGNLKAFVPQQATLFYGGVPFKTGTIKTSRITPTKQSTYLASGLSSLKPGIKSKSLRELIGDSSITLSTSSVKRVFVKKTIAGDLQLILNGKDYNFPNTPTGIIDFSTATSSDAFTATLDKPNAWAPKVVPGTGASPLGLTGTYLYVKLVQYYTTSPGVYAERDAVDPLLPLSVLVHSSENINDYKLEVDLGNYFNDYVDLNAVSTYSDKVKMPVLFVKNLHGETDPRDNEIVNAVNNTGLIKNDPNFGFNNNQPGVVRNNNSLQLFIRLRYLLDLISIYLQTPIDGDFYDDTTDILIDNSYSLNVPLELIGQQTENGTIKKFIFWRQKCDVKELVPDIKVTEFLKQICDRYNASCYYNEHTRKVSLNYREEMVKKYGYRDITSLCTQAEEYNDATITGYSITIDKEDTDSFSEVEKFIYATPQDEYTISCGRIMKSNSALLFGGIYTAPYKQQEAGKKFSLRLFTWIGNVYNGAFVYNGSQPGPSLADLHNTYHKYWLLARTKRITVKLGVRFSLADILRIDWSSKYRFDRNNYLIKRITAKITNKAVAVSSVELWKV